MGGYTGEDAGTGGAGAFSTIRYWYLPSDLDADTQADCFLLAQYTGMDRAGDGAEVLVLPKLLDGYTTDPRLITTGHKGRKRMTDITDDILEMLDGSAEYSLYESQRRIAGIVANNIRDLAQRGKDAAGEIERLEQQNRYLLAICSRLVAAWDNELRGPELATDMAPIVADARRATNSV